MAVEFLIAYWIVPRSPSGPLGLGVTAHSLDDALGIIHRAGYAAYLPDDPGSLDVTEGVKVADLEWRHVREHMGPIVVRGLWYPFLRVGV